MLSLFRPGPSFGPTLLFVLLWASGAIFSKWGLSQASAIAFLCMRFALALAVLAAVAAWRRRTLVHAGSLPALARTGAILVGGYSVCYFLALDQGFTPGAMAAVLGLQPVLTLLITERPLRRARIAGLLVAFGGLVLLVLDGLLRARLGIGALAFALASLACITFGTMMQKRIGLPPAEVLPVQYAVALAMCLLLLPVEPLRIDWTPSLLVSVGWLALVISVAASLLLYRLIHAGNLVNVTSLFYLVPPATALMDWLFLGNAMAPLALAGTAAILGGVALVNRTPAG